MVLDRENVTYRCLLCIIGIVMILLSFTGPAFGQFIVQPMQLELPAAPNKRIRTELQLQNHAPDENAVVDIRILDLTQEGNGAWLAIESDSNDFDTSKLCSCKDWISLSDNSMSISPLTIGHLWITIKVPAGIQGVYSAAIAVRLRSEEEVGGLNVIFEFLVPVIIHIQGRIPRSQVDLTDLEMELRPADGPRPATTLVSMDVINKGGSYSQLRGLLRLWAHTKEHWRKVAEREITVHSGLLPGSELKLTTDLGRPLPPGKYRIGGALMVDGRRAGSYTKEVEFAGDPTIKRVAADAALDLKPADIVINSLPGSTRTQTVRVHNASDDDVDVQVRKALPPLLGGVAIGDFKGVDLSCTDWLEVKPKKFRVLSGAGMNIQVIARMPNPEANYPCYYAVLGLFATYPDGQDAGRTIANVCVVNQEAEITEDTWVAQRQGPPGFTLEAESTYVITSVFGNSGKMHFTPRSCEVIVTPINPTPNNPDRINTHSEYLRSDKQGVILPFEFRQFSGILDFSDTDAGFYRVLVNLEYGSDEFVKVATSQVGVEISVEGERRILRTLDVDEMNKRMGVRWR